MSDAYGDPVPPQHGEPENVTDPLDAFVWTIVRTGDVALIEDALNAAREDEEAE